MASDPVSERTPSWLLQCSRGTGTPDGRLFAGNNVPDLELQCSRGKCAPDHDADWSEWNRNNTLLQCSRAACTADRPRRLWQACRHRLHASMEPEHRHPLWPRGVVWKCGDGPWLQRSRGECAPYGPFDLPTMSHRPRMLQCSRGACTADGLQAVDDVLLLDAASM